MNLLDDYIAKRSKKDPKFTKLMEQKSINLEVAIKVRSLREDLRLNQRDFAKLIKKPQSTVSRIESGNMNVSTKLLAEIAQATKQRLTIQFDPLTKDI